jgi:hypothetical protein
MRFAILHGKKSFGTSQCGCYIKVITGIGIAQFMWKNTGNLATLHRKYFPK